METTTMEIGINENGSAKKLKLSPELINFLCNILERRTLTEKMILKLLTAKYLVLIDMGCGSCSAVVVELPSNGISILHNDDKIMKYDSLAYMGHINDVIHDSLQAMENSQEQEDSLRAVEKIVHFTSEKATDNGISIPTLIGTDTNEWVIGEPALEMDGKAENFKTLPTDDALKEKLIVIDNPIAETHVSYTLEEIWKNYYRILVSQIAAWCVSSDSHIEERISETDLKNKSVFLVAHPAGANWENPDILENYRKLFVDGVKVPEEAVYTISEARAALMYVKRKARDEKQHIDSMAEGADASKYDAEDKKQHIDSMAEGTLVIDIGASTIDIACQGKSLYQLRKELTPTEFSMTVAGRDVDRLLAHYVLCQTFKHAMDNTAVDYIPDETKYQNLCDGMGKPISEFMFECRNAKEIICNEPEKETVKLSPLTVGNEGVEVNAAIIKQLIGIDTANKIPYTPVFDAEYELPMSAGYAKIDEIKPGIQLFSDTWKGHLNNLLDYCFDENNPCLYREKENIKKVIVTGGSAQLLGMKELFDDYFKKQLKIDINVVMLTDGIDYEMTVPIGTSEYLTGIVTYLKELIYLPTELEKKIKYAIIQPLAASIQQDIEADVLTIYKSCTQDWANYISRDAIYAERGDRRALQRNYGEYYANYTQPGSKRALIDKCNAEVTKQLGNESGKETRCGYIKKGIENLKGKETSIYQDIVQPLVSKISPSSVYPVEESLLNTIKIEDLDFTIPTLNIDVNTLFTNVGLFEKGENGTFAKRVRGAQPKEYLYKGDRITISNHVGKFKLSDEEKEKIKNQIERSLLEPEEGKFNIIKAIMNGVFESILKAVYID